MPKLLSFFFCCKPKKENINIKTKFYTNYSNSKINIEDKQPKYESYDCYYDSDKDFYYSNI